MSGGQTPSSAITRRSGPRATAGSTRVASARRDNGHLTINIAGEPVTAIIIRRHQEPHHRHLLEGGALRSARR